MKRISCDCVHAGAAVLGEGPVWEAKHQRLWWVDIERKEIHRFDPSDRSDETWTFPDRVGFVIPTTRGDFIVGMQRGLVRFSEEDGASLPFAAPESHRPGNRFNDAKCDDAGRLWAGTMAVSETPEQGSLYRIETDLRITRVVEGVSISNGLAWSTDRRTLYYVDSPIRTVDAFDFDPATGEVANRRPVITIPDGFPDGMCIDTKGHLWIAVWGGWKVDCRDPVSGQCLARIDVPVADVTSCCFGGPHWDELYITTSSRDLDAVGRQEQPLAGAVFVAKPGVTGPPTRRFAG